MREIEHVLTYKCDGSRVQVRLLLSKEEIEDIKLESMYPPQSFQVVLEMLKEMLNSGFDKTRIATVFSRRPNFEKKLADLLDKIVADICSLRVEYATRL